MYSFYKNIYYDYDFDNISTINVVDKNNNNKLMLLLKKNNSVSDTCLLDIINIPKNPAHLMIICVIKVINFLIQQNLII